MLVYRPVPVITKSKAFPSSQTTSKMYDPHDPLPVLGRRCAESVTVA